VQRLAWMLAVSACLHAALILGVAIQPAAPRGATQTVIEARLLPAQPEPLKAQEAKPLAELAVPPQQPQQLPAKESAEKAVPEAAETTAAVAPPDTAARNQSSPLPALDIPLAEDPTYYPGKQLDVHPAALQPIVPAYPDAVSFAGIEGTVTVLLLIDEFGTVRDVSVVEATPPGYFEESALAAFRSARFTAAIKDGRAVKSRVLIRVSYTLDQPQAIPMPRRKPAE
jgi:protein TonB